MTLQEFISSHGLPENLPINGIMQRFDYRGDNDGWWIGSTLESGTYITVGSWKTDERHTFKNGSGSGDFEREISILKEENEKVLQENRLDCAARARKTIKELKEINSFNNSYLIKKGLGEFKKPASLKHIYEDGEDLIVAAYNKNHGFNICGFQRIPPDGIKKRFCRGMEMSGTYYNLHGPEGAKTIFCEGISTALSIYLALNESCHVIACFNADNIIKVMDVLVPIIQSKNVYEKPLLFVAADDDRWGKVNKGIECAREACKKYGAGLLIPQNLSSGNTDWNDYHAEFGIDETMLELIHQMENGQPRARSQSKGIDLCGQVFGIKNMTKLADAIIADSNTPIKEIAMEIFAKGDCAVKVEFNEQTSKCDTTIVDIESLPAQNHEQYISTIVPNADRESGTTVHGAGLSGLQPLEIRHNKAGKPILPTPQEVSDALVSYYANTLMREAKDVFEWKYTHWIELNPTNFRYQIKREAQILMSGLANDRFLDGVFNLFMGCLPQPPDGQSFYMQLKNISNFKDGTLWLLGRGKESYLEFRPHVQSDLITWILPYEYKAPRPVNEKFNAWLDRTFQGNEDAAGKIKAMRMLGGACLIPMFSCLGFFYGPAGTGKSTFAKLCMAFMGRGNFSTLPPEEMHGFQLETMINKRVNIVTDIAGGRVDKGIFKRFADKMEMHVNRKNKTAVDARLPLLHIFCGNELPVGMDCISTAMDRRIAIVEVNNQLAIADMQEDLELTILENGAGAILDFFEAGLRDLCANGGRYFNPDSGKAIFEEYKNEHPTRAFIEAIKKGEIFIGKDELFIEENSRIFQPDLAQAFFEFGTKTGGKWTPTRHKFYREMRQLGYTNVVINGKDYFCGIGRRLGVSNHATHF